MTAHRSKTYGAAALLAGACLLLAACAGSGGPASSSSASGSSASGGAGVPEHAALAGPAKAPAPPLGPAAGTQLTRLPGPGSLSIIYTARLTVRAKNVADAASHAAQAAAAAGGYVAAENATADQKHPARATVSIELKVPVAAYRATLAALSRLGQTRSQSQRAADVTQTVADVTSRVASAKAAIRQLRALLARAGSVSSLLTVQDRINTEEAALESLLAQQRALARQTSYASISLLLVSTPPPGVKHHHPKRAGGFTGGLDAGWQALRAVVSGLLTGLGAVLPFAVPVALLAALGFAGMRWRLRRRAGPRAAG